MHGGMYGEKCGGMCGGMRGGMRGGMLRERWRAVFYFSGASVKIFSSADTVSAIFPEGGREMVSCSCVVTLDALNTDAELFRE